MRNSLQDQSVTTALCKLRPAGQESPFPPNSSNLAWCISTVFILSGFPPPFVFVCLSRVRSHSGYCKHRRTWTWWGGWRSVRNGWRVMFNSQAWTSRAGVGMFFPQHKQTTATGSNYSPRRSSTVSLFFVIHWIPAFHSLNQIRSALQPATGTCRGPLAYY